MDIIDKFKKRGLRIEEFKVKVFGGAGLKTGNKLNIGAKNVAQAMDTLKKYNIFPMSKDVLGNYSRKLIYFSNTGEVWIKKLKY
jgi:chemotaxis protein CheD